MKSVLLLVGALLATMPVMANELPYTHDFQSATTGPVADHELAPWVQGFDFSAVVEQAHAYEGSFTPLSGSSTKLLDIVTVDGLQVPVTMNDGEHQEVYVDTLMFLEPCDAHPAYIADNDEVKLSVHMNDNGDVVLFHGGATGNANTTTVIPLGAATSAWYRVTIRMHMEAAHDGVETYPFFQVLLDGQILTSVNHGFAVPVAASANYTGGSWFRFANRNDQSGSHRKMSAVAFQGAGKLDELVVAVSPSISDLSASQAIWDGTASGVTYGLYESTDLPGESMTWSQVGTAETGVGEKTTAVTTSGARHCFEPAPHGLAPGGLNAWTAFNLAIPVGFSFIGVPMEMSNGRSFHGALGQQLSDGLSDGDKVHVWDDGHWVALTLNSGTWSDDHALPRGVGFFVERVAGTPTSVVFRGPIGNGGEQTTTVSDAHNGWNPISLSEGRHLTVQQAFRNVDSGTPVGHGDPYLADRVIGLGVDGWVMLVRQANGNWLRIDQSGQGDGNGYVLEPGRAFYYKRMSGSGGLTVRF